MINMKIVKKENLGTTFDEIKCGECFTIEDTEMYFMKTPSTISPITDAEFNSIDLSNGSFYCYLADQKVVKVDCELHVKGEEK